MYLADAIIATDMANHSRYMALFRSDVLLQEKGVLLALILKAAALSNIVRPFSQSQRWNGCLRAEFYLQGAQERSLGYSAKLKCMDEERDHSPLGRWASWKRLRSRCLKFCWTTLDLSDTWAQICGKTLGHGGEGWSKKKPVRKPARNKLEFVGIVPISEK